MIVMLITTIWLGSLGFADDYIKIFKKDKEEMCIRDSHYSLHICSNDNGYSCRFCRTAGHE